MNVPQILVKMGARVMTVSTLIHVHADLDMKDTIAKQVKIVEYDKRIYIEYI